MQQKVDLRALLKQLDKSWLPFVENEIKQPYFAKLQQAVALAYSQHQCFPETHDIFRLLKLTIPAKIKVIVIGQDPYHNFNQADGIAFSCQNNPFKTPPSLLNIFKELKNDCLIDHAQNLSLQGWVKQGVFLMNTVWTVQAHQAFSHHDFGWQTFSTNLLKFILNNSSVAVAVLWGKKAQTACEALLATKCSIIKSAHPSPFSYKLFKNSKPFSKINTILARKNLLQIDWTK